MATLTQGGTSRLFKRAPEADPCLEAELAEIHPAAFDTRSFALMPVNCPALTNWVYVPANREAVCLVAPAKLKMRYDDMGWIVERTFEQAGMMTSHRLSPPVANERDAVKVLITLCGLDPADFVTAA